MRPSEPNRAFAALRRLVQQEPPVEKCELCSAALAPSHQHLIEVANRRMVCACDPCAILFDNHTGREIGRYRRVSRRLLYLPDFRLTDEQWDRLLIPINLAFIFYSASMEKVVALYPGPAGATESSLKLEVWEEIARQNAILGEMEPDIEALLINRMDTAHGRNEYYLAPIDECYRLVGIIRSGWRGVSGGVEVRQRISQFFAALQQQAKTIGGSTGA